MANLVVTLNGRQAVTVSGAAAASQAALDARDAADQSEAAAGAAEALVGPTYANTSAGLAATTSGDYFAVNGSGTVSIYLNSAGSAVLQRTIATSAALAASTGAALIGVTGGGTLQAYLDAITPSFTFANRPDPASYINKQGIIITDERNGIQPCYSDGTRWRRRSDGRTAQSSVITYYVDGTGGNDANSGTSAAPIKTLTQLKALVAALPAYRRCGLRFAFKRGTSIGGFWTLDANNFGNIFEAYSTASLARPIFDCADTLTNASFTVDGTYTNCYNYTIAPNIESAPAEVPGIWVDGERYAYVASKALCDTMPGTFTHSTPTGLTSLVITVNSGTNPASDGKVYAAAIRSHAISALAADECEFRDLHGKRCYGSYGTFPMGNYAIAERLLDEDANAHNFYYGPYSVLTDCEARDCNAGWAVSATNFIGFANPIPTNAWAKLIRCRVNMTKNSLKPKVSLTGVNLLATMTVTVGTHNFAQGDYVIVENAGGSTWLNNVRWYVNGVSGSTLTLYAHSYTTNRLAAFDARALAAWTSGGTVRLAPTCVAGAIGFYSHGPSNGIDLWDRVEYIDCEAHGVAVPVSCADVRECAVTGFYATQWQNALNPIAYSQMVVKNSRFENTPACNGSLAAVVNGGRLKVDNTTFTINSTGYFQVSGAGDWLDVRNVRMEGVTYLIRGLAANQVIKCSRLINVPNANISQATLYNFNGSTTGLSLTSDMNDFGSFSGGFTITGTAHANLAAYQLATGQDLNTKA